MLLLGQPDAGAAALDTELVTHRGSHREGVVAFGAGGVNQSDTRGSVVPVEPGSEPNAVLLGHAHTFRRVG